MTNTSAMNQLKATLATLLACLAVPSLASADRLVEVSRAVTAHNTVTATVYDRDGTPFVFSGGDGGFIDVFRLEPDGSLVAVERQPLVAKKGPGRGFVGAKVGDNHFFFAGNKGGDAIEVFSLAEDGTLELVHNEHDSPDTHIAVVITLRVLHTAEGSFLFAGGLEFDEPGLTCYEIQPDGSLVHVQSMLDNDTLHTDGIIAMYDTTIGGKRYLVTGGFQDNGLSSFLVHDDGTFENVSNIGDNTTDLFLTGTYPVDGVTLGDNHYVVVGHRHHKYYRRLDFIKQKDFVYHGDAVSIFRLDEDGQIRPHSVLMDDEQTRLQGQTRIEVMKINDSEAAVVVGTRDDESLQICRLSADGTLRPTGVLGDVFPIYYGLASYGEGSDLRVIAGSVDFNLKRLVSYRLELSDVEAASDSGNGDLATADGD